MHTTENSLIRDRIEELGRELDALPRGNRADAGQTDAAAAELSGFHRRHGDLRQRAAQAESGRSADDALEADLQGLKDAVRRWIKRQDRKARKARNLSSA